MKRFLLITLSLVMLLSLCTACSRVSAGGAASTDSESAPAEAAAESPTEATVEEPAAAPVSEPVASGELNIRFSDSYTDNNGTWQPVDGNVFAIVESEDAASSGVVNFDEATLEFIDGTTTDDSISSISYDAGSVVTALVLVFSIPADQQENVKQLNLDDQFFTLNVVA